LNCLIDHVNVIPDGSGEIADGAVLIDGEKIAAVFTRHDAENWKKEHAAGRTGEQPANNCEAAIWDGHGLKCTPGLIDIHIHGAAGYDLISGSQEALEEVSANLAADGCTAFVASLTVLGHKETLAVLDAYAAARQPAGAQLLGVHMEGPYLNPRYKALMDERYLRDPDLGELKEMIDHAGGRLKIMTVAPERQGMEAFIAAAAAQGITIMIGHTAADSRTVHRAREAGALGFTHLYNAMSQHLHREPGTVTGAFLQTEMLAELMCDGFHVDPDVVKMTYNVMGARRLVLITDAMLGKGMPDGDFTFSGLKCRKQGTRVTVIETGRRAGSAFALPDAIRFLQTLTGCRDADIVHMACVNPARLARAGAKGRLAKGYDADIGLFDKDWNCRGTIVKGQWKFRKST
jgi:N-acetylglucosamine-6-phosphate deacetylase